MKQLGFYEYSSNEIIIKRNHHYTLMGEKRYQVVYIPEDALLALKVEKVTDKLVFPDNLKRNVVRICLYVEENVARRIESTQEMSLDEICNIVKETLP